MSDISNISSFIDTFGAGARANRFQVEFQLPKGIDFSTDNTKAVRDIATAVNTISVNKGNSAKLNKNLNSNNAISIACNSAQLPGSNLQVDYNYVLNRHIAKAYDTQPVSFTFYSDEYYSQRRFFESWFNTVINVNQTLNFHDEYVSDLRIYQLDRKGNKTYGVILYDAFPTTVAPVDLSTEQDNSIVRINVTITYKRWESAEVV